MTVIGPDTIRTTHDIRSPVVEKSRSEWNADQTALVDFEIFHRKGFEKILHMFVLAGETRELIGCLLNLSRRHDEAMKNVRLRPTSFKDSSPWAEPLLRFAKECVQMQASFENVQSASSDELVLIGDVGMGHHDWSLAVEGYCVSNNESGLIEAVRGALYAREYAAALKGLSFLRTHSLSFPSVLFPVIDSAINGIQHTQRNLPTASKNQKRVAHGYQLLWEQLQAYLVRSDGDSTER